MTVGVLALQGDFERHQERLAALGVEVVLVKYAGDLDRVEGLVIPGGESTTIRRLLVRSSMWEQLRYRVEEGLPVFGTCAGLILLSRNVVAEDEDYGLGALPVTVERNAWGRQRESFEAPVRLAFDDTPVRGVFIRAPRILDAGEAEVLGRLADGEPVLVRYRNVLGATFHPELTEDLRVHRYFLSMMEEAHASQKS